MSMRHLQSGNALSLDPLKYHKKYDINSLTIIKDSISNTLENIFPYRSQSQNPIWVENHDNGDMFIHATRYWPSINKMCPCKVNVLNDNLYKLELEIAEFVSSYVIEHNKRLNQFTKK